MFHNTNNLTLNFVVNNYYTGDNDDMYMNSINSEIMWNIPQKYILESDSVYHIDLCYKKGTTEDIIKFDACKIFATLCTTGFDSNVLTYIVKYRAINILEFLLYYNCGHSLLIINHIKHNDNFIYDIIDLYYKKGMCHNIIEELVKISSYIGIEYIFVKYPYFYRQNNYYTFITIILYCYDINKYKKNVNDKIIYLLSTHTDLSIEHRAFKKLLKRNVDKDIIYLYLNSGIIVDKLYFIDNVSKIYWWNFDVCMKYYGYVVSLKEFFNLYKNKKYSVM